MQLNQQQREYLIGLTDEILRLNFSAVADNMREQGQLGVTVGNDAGGRAEIRSAILNMVQSGNVRGAAQILAVPIAIDQLRAPYRPIMRNVLKNAPTGGNGGGGGTGNDGSGSFDWMSLITEALGTVGIIFGNNNNQPIQPPPTDWMGIVKVGGYILLGIAAIWGVVELAKYAFGGKKKD